LKQIGNAPPNKMCLGGYKSDVTAQL